MRPTEQIIVLACAFGMLTAAPVWATNGDTRPLLDAQSLSMFEILDAESLSTFKTAAGGPMETVRSQARGVYPENLVRKVQQGLADQGFYLGPLDGRFGPKTEAAIRAYQKSADLPVDGVPSASLAIDLETGGKVGQLLNRLEKSRTATAQSAREALLSRPETRHLVNAPTTADSAAHDSKACMARPEPKCLLIEASISAGDIEKPEMRDWALGEILTSQAKAGLAGDALGTTRRIHDPRLIMVALRDIAKAQAAGGHNAEAMAAVDIIPDLEQQVEAYVAIAEVQAINGQVSEAEKTVKHLVDYLRRMDNPLTKIQFRTRIAVIVYKANNEALSQKHVRAAEALVDTIHNESDRDEGLRYIAGAYAETGNPTMAMTVLKRVTNAGDDFPVLIAAATGLAQAGDAGEAMITADSIEAVRYRALVLARIASYQAGAGDLESARVALDKALLAAQKIKFPFAKAYAYSRIALALNDVGISASNDAEFLSRALDATILIKDDRLRAHILWTIADERRRAQDTAGTSLALEQAQLATDDIKSPFSRVWMLCDIAVDRAQRQEIDAAWALFGDAMIEAKSITHPWGRARALSKVAGTMTILTDHTSRAAQR